MLIRVLGPLVAEVGGGAVPLGGPLQRAVLALLVSARGRVVSVDRMIEELWRGEAPAKATASLQAYVSNLRKLLEPGRPPRAPATVLVSAAPGYALRLADESVDAWHFERLVRAARENPALCDEALALWRGPAFAEFADEGWARAEADRLAELRAAVGELRVAAGLRAGAAAAVVADAGQLTRDFPLREEGWRLHALALWGSGRQADALATLRRAREVLAEELGLDPGPALAELEQGILQQRVEDPLGQQDGEEHAVGQRDGESLAGTSHQPGDSFVGRSVELAALETVARADGTRVALVTGEVGLGKSALLARFGARLTDAGWLVVTGRCAEGPGAPGAWPWAEALGGLTTPPPAEHIDVLRQFLGETPAPEQDAAVGRFRLLRAISAWLSAAARERPVAVVLDDLHWADSQTLALLAGVDAPVMLVGAYRPDEGGEALAGTLAAMAGRSPVRVALTGLSEEDVAAVAELPEGHPALSALAARTGGNPFYVKESARLLRSEGELVALSEVPDGVRDVLRRRLARLPEDVIAVVRLAAVVGRQSDIDVLVAANEDEDATLDALEAGVIAGVLTEPAPGQVRFGHALVRDTLLADLSRVRRARMHATIGAVLERLAPDDVAALAYHFHQAAVAAKAVHYCVRAAQLAERRYAHDVAAGLLADAVANVARTGTPDEHVALLGRLLRAQVRAGAVTAARETRQRAVAVAEAAGREDLLVAAFTAWTEPSPWQSRPYGTRDDDVIALLTRLLDKDDLDAVARARLLDAYADEQSGDGTAAAREAAEKAVALAEEVGEPGLHAHALAILGTQVDGDLEWREQERLGVAIVRLGETHDLPVYRGHGKIVQACALASAGEVARLRDLVDEAMTLGRAYRLNELVAVVEGARAMLTHISGDFAGASRQYAEAAGRMAGHGSPHGVGYGALAEATVRLDQGADVLDLARELYASFGPTMADLYAMALAAAGRIDEARAVRAHAVPIRPDYFFTALATVRAMAVVALGERDAAGELYEILLPYHGVLAGVASLSLAMRPVAYTLGELASLLDRPAREHVEEALAVAERWQAPHWIAAARLTLTSRWGAQ